MKITKFKRALSVLLVAVMVLSALPLNTISLDGNGTKVSTNGIIDDWLAWLRNWIWEHNPESRQPITVTDNGVSLTGTAIRPDSKLEAGSVADPFADDDESPLPGGGRFVALYDIILKKYDGTLYQPESAVDMTIDNVKANADHDLRVFHILEDEAAIMAGIADGTAVPVDDPAFVRAFKNQARAAQNITNRDDVVFVEIFTTQNGRLTRKTNSDGTVAFSFEATSFSIYAVVDMEDDESVARARIIFEDANGNPYTFLNNNGATVDNQIVRTGSFLEDVGMPTDIDVDTQTFQGWYIYDKANARYTSYQLRFGSTNTWTVEYDENNKSITSNTATVTSHDMTNDEATAFYARPYYGEVKYLSFYNDCEGSVILTRVQVISGTSYDISTHQAVPPDAIQKEDGTWEPVSYVFVGWSEESGENDDNRTAITNTTVTVNGDKSYYPIFKQGHWVSFSSAPAGSGATYIPAKIVLSTQTSAAARPTTIPTWKGHTFVGWFTTPETYDPDNANYRNADGTINTAYNGYMSTNESSNGAYGFNESLDDDITLYAHWNAGTANVTVVKWQQVVTDNKNAATPTKEQMSAEGYAANTGLKHYEYAGQQNLNETVNSILRNNDGDIVIPVGFGLNGTLSDSQVVVMDDGTAVLNLYFDRKLITLNFDRDIEVHTVATGTSGTQYGLVNGEYVRITWNGTNWVYTTTEQVTEYVNYTGTRYNTTTSNNTNPQQYGVYNNQVVQLYYHPRNNYGQYHWSRNQTHSWGDGFDDTRYVQNANGTYGFVNGSMVQLVNGQYQTTTTQTTEHIYEGTRYVEGTTRSFTGLYGQTLAQNGYAWPSNIGWEYEGYNQNNNGTWSGPDTYQMSYLGQFVIPTNRFKGANDTVTTINFSSRYASSTIYYYVQNADGSWPGEGEYIDAGLTAAGTIQIAEKFDGFTMDAYEYNNNGRGAEYTANNASWTRVSPGESSKTVYNGMAIRYRRMSYTVKFLDSRDGSVLSDIASVNVMYGASMSTADPGDDVTVTNTNTQYVWDGKWYKDQACTEEFNFNDTMPNHDVAVYAGWNEVWYWIKIDPNGGVLTSTEATWFWESYGGIVEEYHDVYRNYEEADDGEYYYHYDEFDPETELNQYGKDERKAEYRLISENPNWQQDSYDGKRYRPATTYSFVGWYKVKNDGTLEPYNFTSPVTENLTIRALWRVVGEYNVKYSYEGVDSDGNPINISGSGDLPVDLNKYADKSSSSILKAILPPQGYSFVGWYYNGHVYNPGDTFIIDADLAEPLEKEDGSVEKNIWIYPVFLTIEDQPVVTTHIRFVGNGGTSNVSGSENLTVTETTITMEGIQPNSTVSINGTENYFKRKGYTFVGWGKRTEGTTTTARNFIKYDPETQKYYRVSDNREVLGIAADELEDYEELYALWDVNKYTVTVIKEVESVFEDDQKLVFPFTPVFTGDLSGEDYQRNFGLSGTEYTEELTDEDGNAVTVEHKTEKVFVEVPYGTKVSFTEYAENFDITVSGKYIDDEEGEKTIEGLSNGSEFTVNGDTEITFKNKRQTVDVDIEKEVTGVASGVTVDDEFTFTVKVNDKDFATVKLKDGEKTSKNADNTVKKTVTVPKGSTVKIVEVKDNNYTTTASQTESAADFAFSAEDNSCSFTATNNSTVKFVNERKPVTVTVTKTIAEGDAAYVGNDTFKFGFTGKDDFTLDPDDETNKTKTFTLPYGTEFTLTEKDLNTAKYGIAKFDGSAAATEIAASYSKEYTANGDLDIKVENNVRKYDVTLKKEVTKPAGYEDVAADTSHEFTVKVVSDNTAFTVSDQTIKVGENAVIKNVPYGVKLTLTEQDRAGYEYKSGNGVYTVTGDKTVTFKNERKFVDVTVTKVLDSKLPSDVTRDYTFTYSYTDGTSVTGGDSFIIKVNGQPEASGEHQGKYVGVDRTTVKVPAGASLTVSETNFDGFETSGTTKTTPNVTVDPAYVFTNEREVVDVKITKTVDSTVDSDKTGKYSFNYTYSYVDGQNVVTVNKTETIDLSGEGAHEILIQNVPKNVTGFVITETAASGTTLESAGAFITTSATASGATGTPNNANRSITITKITGDVVEVNFKNTRETVDITIEKKVENEKAAALRDEFTFNVNKQDGGYTFTVDGVQKNSAEFKLAHNGYKTITVPIGVDVVIEETANNNYTTAITGATSTNGLIATVKTDATTGSYTVTYTNTRKPITVNVTKELDNLGMNDSWNNFPFPISYKIDNGGWTAIAGGVKAGETKTVEVPYGSKIEIKELDEEKNNGLAIKDYFNNDGPKSIESVTTEGQTLTIKNTRKTVPVTVTKEVVSRITADNSRDYKFTITTNSTDQKYASQTVTINTINGEGINGTGSATKDVPKGANVTVTETNANTTAFTVEYKDGGTYQLGSSKTVDNVTASTEFVIRNTRKEYDLTISKTVNNFEASGIYPVTYKITYTEGGNTQTIVESTISFTFTKDDSHKTVKVPVPYGCKVEVSENTAAEITINRKDYPISEAFDTTVNGETKTSHTIDSMTQNEVVNVVNTRKTQTVTVHKVVNNNKKWNIDADKTAKFEIKVNGMAETIQVNNYEWSNVYTVYYGDAFTAEETADPAFNTKVGYANNSLANGNSKNIANVDKNSEHDIWFENTRKEIVVTVHKIVTDPAEQNDEFIFTADLKFGNQSLTLPDADKSFTLKNYETATGSYKEKQITIPYGASIKVAENNYAPRYSSTSHITVEGESKTGYSQDYKALTKNALIEVTNDRKWTYIPVSKVLEAKGATKDKDIEFEFTWQYEVEGRPVTGTLKLKGGETKDNVVRVPIGSTVTITETDISLEAYYTGKKVSDIFTTTNNHGSDKVATLTNVKAKNGDETVDNTVIFTNTHKTVEVFLQKTVEYDYDKNTDFTFTYSGINNGIEAGSTTRKHNAGSVQLVEIPVGTGIEVKETSVTGFSTTAVVNNTTYVLGDGNAVTLNAIYEETKINYTNTRILVDVVITKEVVNKGITADNEIQFEFGAAAQFDADHTIVLAKADETFNLAHGGSHTIKVPYGATVTVTENTSMTLEGYNVPVSTVFDTVKAINVFENVTENVSATVTNTHKDVSVKVTKAVVGLDLDKNIEFEFTAEAVRGGNKVTLPDFKLKGADGSKDKILTIPYGTTLTVTEKTENTLSEYGNAKVSDVFTTTNDTYTFQPAVDSTQTVTVTNTHNTVKVTVTKTVEGVAGIDDKILYPMTITSVKGAEKAAIEGVDKNDGFKLNGIAEGADKQNTKTFVVYYGTDVTVNELINTQLTEYAGKKISDVFNTTNASTNLVNVTEAKNVEVTNAHKTVKVTVNKVVESEDPADMEKEFSFSATAKIGTTETLGSDDASFTFSLANGDSKQIDVYYGAEFSVEENLGNEASKYIVTVNGEKQFTAYENAEITFTNKRAAGDLTITKTVIGRKTTDAFVFEITKVDDESFAPLYVTIHPETPEGNSGYGSVTIKQLEAGKYTVRELDNWSWAYDVVDEKVKSATIVGGDQKQVNFTNKDKETNWLRDETSNENSFTNSVPADDTAKSVEAVAWDSKFRLSYAAPVGKFEDKETA